jgi:hypothetical protein
MESHLNDVSDRLGWAMKRATNIVSSLRKDKQDSCGFLLVKFVMAVLPEDECPSKSRLS